MFSFSMGSECGSFFRRGASLCLPEKGGESRTKKSRVPLCGHGRTEDGHLFVLIKTFLSCSAAMDIHPDDGMFQGFVETELTEHIGDFP